MFWYSAMFIRALRCPTLFCCLRLREVFYSGQVD